MDNQDSGCTAKLYDAKESQTLSHLSTGCGYTRLARRGDKNAFRPVPWNPNNPPPLDPPVFSIFTLVCNRFGVCEAYSGDIEVCNGVYTPLRDFVFVSISFGTQNIISWFLEQKIPSYLGSSSPIHDTPCYTKIRELICKYYLSPCGNKTVQYPPYSICPDDCLAVQLDCPYEWELAHSGLDGHNFIQCNFTSAIIFPLHSCCVGQNEQIEEGIYQIIINVFISFNSYRNTCQ